jgi:lipoprotein NlpI
VAAGGVDAGFGRGAVAGFGKGAIEDFDNALQIDPRRARPYTNRGIALAAKGEFCRAIDDFDQAIRLEPEATWPRYNRLLALLSSGRKEASIEARNLLERIGWNDELSVHTALIGYFAALRNGQAAEAENILTKAATHCNPKQWTYSVIRFLRGEIGEQELLALATDASRKTEIHSFLGLRESLKGHLEEALPHLRWVKQNGVSSNAEYPIAVAELDRIEGRRSELSPAHTPTEYADEKARSSPGDMGDSGL